MNDLMEYKGYSAIIEYSAQDRCLFGRVLAVADTLVFDGRTVEELESSFHTCVDEYLQLCAEIGKQPEKEFKGTFNVRIPPELHKKASVMAQARSMSLNSFVMSAIERAVNAAL